MRIDQNLFESVQNVADRVTVEQVFIGLGYTVVTTSDGGFGIAATGVAPDGSRSGSLGIADYEGRPAIDLLAGIQAPDPMLRALALALINALNHSRAIRFPEDSRNQILFEHFNILDGARVAMVGYFPPLVRFLEKERIPLSVIDNARGIGDKKTFEDQLENWADVLILTATSIINSTMEALLSHASPKLRTVILGPSTPMLPAAFAHLPVHMLAGSAITDHSGALKVVRHGGGTRALKPFSRKVYWCADAIRKSSPPSPDPANGTG